MELSLCDKFITGDIPVIEFTEKEECLDFLYDWLSTKDFDKSVFVCFANWRNSDEEDFLDYKDFRNEQNSILVGHCWDDITDMFDSYLDVINFNQMSFSVFEFDSYKEAFEYCIDLKESC